MQRFEEAGLSAVVAAGAHGRRDRRDRGRRAEIWGRVAEDCAARAYEARGAEVLARRRRIGGGEIDLVVREGDAIVFVEVKARSNRAAAIETMTPARWRRLGAAAQAFAAETNRFDCDLRLDLAAVDGAGAVTLYENAGFDACSA